MSTLTYTCLHIWSSTTMNECLQPQTFLSLTYACLLGTSSYIPSWPPSSFWLSLILFNRLVTQVIFTKKKIGVIWMISLPDQHTM